MTDEFIWRLIADVRNYRRAAAAEPAGSWIRDLFLRGAEDQKARLPIQLPLLLEGRA